MGTVSESRKAIRFLDTFFSIQGEFQLDDFKDVTRDVQRLYDHYLTFTKATGSDASFETFTEAAWKLVDMHETKHNGGFENAMFDNISHGRLKKASLALLGVTQINYRKHMSKSEKNVDLGVNMERMYRLENVFLSVAHGLQFVNKPFVVPENVTFIIVNSKGFYVTKWFASRLSEAFKTPRIVNRYATNPLWRRRPLPSDDLFRNRIYLPPGSRIDDIMLTYRDNDVTTGIFKAYPSLPQDFGLYSKSLTQRKYNLLPNVLPATSFTMKSDVNHPVMLSHLANFFSERGGGILISLSCRSIRDKSLPFAETRRQNKKDLINRRMNIDTLNETSIRKMYLKTSYPVMMDADTHAVVNIPSNYHTKLMRLHMLGKKTSKVFGGYTHKIMGVDGDRLYFTRLHPGDQARRFFITLSGKPMDKLKRRIFDPNLDIMKRLRISNTNRSNLRIGTKRQVRTSKLNNTEELDVNFSTLRL